MRRNQIPLMSAKVAGRVGKYDRSAAGKCWQRLLSLLLGYIIVLKRPILTGRFPCLSVCLSRLSGKLWKNRWLDLDAFWSNGSGEYNDVQCRWGSHNKGTIWGGYGPTIVTRGEFVALLCENMWSDWGAVWLVIVAGPKNGVLDGGSSMGKGQFWWICCLLVIIEFPLQYKNQIHFSKIFVRTIY